MVETKVSKIIEAAVEDLGFQLVRVLFMGGNSGRNQLQIMAEPVEDREMTVEDCRKLSRHIAALLDVEDPIQLAYALEVSSPGIDRPLVKLADFERYAGFDVRIDLKEEMDGQRRFRGRLESVSGEVIALKTKDRNLQLPFPGIRRAKLILTDELLAAAAAKPEE